MIPGLHLQPNHWVTHTHTNTHTHTHAGRQEMEYEEKLKAAEARSAAQLAALDAQYQVGGLHVDIYI